MAEGASRLGGLSAHQAIEQRQTEARFAADCRFGDPKHLADLIFVQPAKEFQFNDAVFALFSFRMGAP